MHTNGEPCHRHQDANDLPTKMLIHNRQEFVCCFFWGGVVKEKARGGSGQPVRQSITRVSFRNTKNKKPKTKWKIQTTLDSCSSGVHANTGSVKDEPTVRN
jgi:hypothetical protein